MKRKVVNYCITLLILVVSYGLLQAKQQNRNPFAKKINYSEAKSVTKTIVSSNNIKINEVTFKTQWDY
ncbi:MAG: hypothetical protein WC542_03780 [Paludibacter sp.]|jgi:hypothetical protein